MAQECAWMPLGALLMYNARLATYTHLRKCEGFSQSLPDFIQSVIQ
jgi:hypothetical protein